MISAPPKAKAGSSWLGSPPIRLRRKADTADVALTYAPPMRLKVARGAVETCRVVPMMVTFAIGVGVLAALQAVAVWAACPAALGAHGLVAPAAATAPRGRMQGQAEIVMSQAIFAMLDRTSNGKDYWKVNC